MMICMSDEGVTMGWTLGGALEAADLRYPRCPCTAAAQLFSLASFSDLMIGVHVMFLRFDSRSRT